MKKNLSYVLIDNNKYDGSDPVDYNNLLKKVMDIETNDMENLDDPDMQQFAILTYEYEEYKKKELEPVYCTCRNIAHGDMISCDNEKCNIEWFHFACVGLTKLPKGDWFCKVCKSNFRHRL